MRRRRAFTTRSRGVRRHPRTRNRDLSSEVRELTGDKCDLCLRRFRPRRYPGFTDWAAYSLATGAVFLAGFAGIASGNQVGWLNLAFGAAVVTAWVWVSAVCARAGSQGS
jgi:hypothetical protein